MSNLSGKWSEEISNATSFTETLNNTSLILSIIIIWSVGTLVSILSIVVIVLSKSKLEKTEFCILIIFNTLTLVFKVFSTIQYIIACYFPLLIFDCVMSVFNTVWIVFMVKLLFTLVFYSLYQMSTVSRERLFVLVYDHVHSIRNFLIYELVGLVFLVGFDVFNIWMTYRDRPPGGTCPGVVEITMKYVLFKFLVLLMMPSVVLIAIYTLTTGYISYTRFLSPKRNFNKREMRKFRKDFFLLVKFLALSVVFTASSMLQNVFFYAVFILADDSMGFFVIGDVGYSIYALQPLFFIYVHSILKRTFQEYFIRRLFGFILRRNSSK